MLSFRFRLAGILAVAMITNTSYTVRAQQGPASLESLQRSPSCKGNMGKFGFRNPLPGQGTIEMVNDGGWCWVQFGFSSSGIYVVPALTTTQPPQHGTLLVGGIDAQGGKRVRYAYRPAPGFAGSDSFSVHLLAPAGTFDTVVSVTVTK